MGQYYPAYHCARNGHYFRVAKPEFDKSIEDFIRIVLIKHEYIDNVIDAISQLWKERMADQFEAQQRRIEHRESLQGQIRSTVDRMRVLSSESALRFLEEDVVSVEKELAEVEIEIAKQPNLEAEFEVVLMYAKYILEHLSEMLLDLSNPIKRATYFGAIFNKMPTYPQIDLRTTKNSPLPEVNELFKLKTSFLSTFGEPTHIILEPFFDDLFGLKERYEALGMIVKDGKVYLPDLEDLYD